MKKPIFFTFGLFVALNLPSHAVVKTYEIGESSTQRQLRQIHPVNYDRIKEEAGSLVERAQQIERAFLEDRTVEEIRLIGASDSLGNDDMWPVVRGMIARARDSSYTQITALDLSGNDITNTGFSYLYTGLVNRGISDNWGVPEGQAANRLQPLTINLRSNYIKVDELIRSCSEIAQSKGVTFLFQGA